METENLLQLIKDTKIDGPASEFYVRSMVLGLNEKQLKSLDDYYMSNRIFNETRNIVSFEYCRVTTRNSLMKRLHDKAHKRNEPVSQLLSWFKNKKSGKFAYARKQLHKRFLHLNYEDQIAVIRTLLKGGKQDREWCYYILKRWWSSELEEDILSIWNKYHEEKCGWLFPMHMPSETLREHIEELTEELDYYYLCKRLVSEPWFEINKAKLLLSTNSADYMWIISQSKSVLTLDEATLSLYKEIIPFLCNAKTGILTFNWPYPGWKRYEKIFSAREEFHEEDHFFMYKLGKVENILSYMCRKGLQEEVKQFLLVDTKIHENFVSRKKHLFEPIGDFTRQKLQMLYQIYARFLVKILYDSQNNSLQVFMRFFDKDAELDLQPQTFQILEREDQEWGWDEREFEVLRQKYPEFGRFIDSIPDACPF